MNPGVVHQNTEGGAGGFFGRRDQLRSAMQLRDIVRHIRSRRTDDLRRCGKFGVAAADQDNLRACRRETAGNAKAQSRAAASDQCGVSRQ